MSITTYKRRKFWPYLLLGVVGFYSFHWLAKLYEQSPATTNPTDIFGLSRIEWVLEQLDKAPILDVRFNLFSLQIGALGFLIALLFYMRPQVTGVFRYREEHGSARLATQEEMDGLADEVPENNMILSQNARMGLFNKRLPFDKQINKNMFILGGTGDWKTRSIYKPNFLQANSSFVGTDTKGLFGYETGYFFEQMGYKLKYFDVRTFLNTNRFNVFRYMKSEMDIDRVAEAIVTATKKSDNRGEDFWVQAELLLMKALIGYLYFDSQLSQYQANLPQVTDLIRHLRRTDPEVGSPVELMFQELEKAMPGNYACKQWELFNKNFDGETKNSVTAIIAARFSVFDHDEVRKLMEEDNMEIERWHLEKTAVFVYMPEVNEAYKFITSLFFSTVFDVCIKTADKIIKGEVRGVEDLIHIQYMLDEAAQIGKIPNLPEIISVIRSREESIKLAFQSLSQPEEIYGKNNTKTILNNCGTIIYLGTNDEDTSKILSTRAGKMTINDRNTSENYSKQRSNNVQNSKIGRDLFTPHEIATIKPTECLVYVSKHNVFKDKKYILEEHPNAHYLGNSPKDKTWYRHKRYMSDLEEYLDHILPSNYVEVTEEEMLVSRG